MIGIRHKFVSLNLFNKFPPVNIVDDTNHLYQAMG